MVFAAFVAGYIIGTGVILAAVALAAVDPGETRSMTKEKWRDGFREKQ